MKKLQVIILRFKSWPLPARPHYHPQVSRPMSGFEIMSKAPMGRLLQTNNGSPKILNKQKCLSLLTSCSSVPHLLQIQAQIQTLGLSGDQFLTAHLIKRCSLSPFADLSYARSLLSHTPNPSRSCFNHVIRGLSHSDTPGEALAVFSQMRRAGITPNEATYPFVLKSCAHLSALQLGKQVHGDCIKKAIDSVVFVHNTLMLLYGSCRLIRDVRKVFDEMLLRTVVSWNTVLSAHVDGLLCEEAIGLFRRMRFNEVEPDQTTFVVLLSAAAELGILRFGKWIHGQIIGKGFDVNVQLDTAVINMYIKCGDLGFATKVFERMRVRNVWTWSAMILGYAQHGSAKEALDLFSQMKESSIEPNHVTFLGVLCACSHAGLVSEGYRFFNEMVHFHGIKPRMTHYSSMVDVLGRKGHLVEAYDFINQMEIDPDAVVWRTLLSACQLHSARDVKGIGEKVRVRLLELEPKRSGNYVMVANMFSEIGSWEEAAKVRRMMRDEGLKKVAGESCVEVDTSIHRFVSGDDAYSHCECVYDLLDGLSLNMKMVGSKDANFLQELKDNF